MEFQSIHSGTPYQSSISLVSLKYLINISSNAKELQQDYF